MSLPIKVEEGKFILKQHAQYIQYYRSPDQQTTAGEGGIGCHLSGG